jgi:hypothetical protein
MRLHLKDSQPTLVFFLSRSCKSFIRFRTEIMKSLSKEKLLPLGWYSYAWVFRRSILNLSHFPSAMTTTGPFFQFHSPYSSNDDPFVSSKRAVSSHPAIFPVVTQENPFPGHRCYWQGTSFLLPRIRVTNFHATSLTNLDVLSRYSFLPRRWKQRVPPQRWYLPTRLNVVTTHKATIWANFLSVYFYTILFISVSHSCPHKIKIIVNIFILPGKALSLNSELNNINVR